MNKLSVLRPYSGGLFLTYKCNSRCRHCAYASSPGWSADWIPLEDARIIVEQLADMLRDRYADPDSIGVNQGVHFTGGEPFLNYDLLLAITKMATELAIPSTFVETNCFWCVNDDRTRARLLELRKAGLKGILLSANPFLLEWVPFERTVRGARIGEEVFGRNAIVYQRFFFEQFTRLNIDGTLPFDEYLRVGGHGLRHAELLPGGRISYGLADCLGHYPASRFLGMSCRQELLRDWHIHVDNYCNYVPGYCGGISLGDARDLDALCRGIDLSERPVLTALLTSLGDLLELGRQYGYEERETYASKCHLCVDVRRHLAAAGEFKELAPLQFYEHLED